MEQVSSESLSFLSREVILALAAASSRLRSSFSRASGDVWTAFFFCFLVGGARIGAAAIGGCKGKLVDCVASGPGWGGGNMVVGRGAN